jgi:hypothetical protein
MGDCTDDEPSGALYTYKLLNPRTPGQRVVTGLIDVFFFLYLTGLSYQAMWCDAPAGLAGWAYIMFLPNVFFWFILREQAIDGWRSLAYAEKHELPSTFWFPTNCRPDDPDGKSMTAFGFVTCTLLPLAMLLIGPNFEDETVIIMFSLVFRAMSFFLKCEQCGLWTSIGRFIGTLFQEELTSIAEVSYV